jgi:hypothetical protein
MVAAFRRDRCADAGAQGCGIAPEKANRFLNEAPGEQDAEK